MDLEDAVVAAWHATADELPGVRAIVDRAPRPRPIDAAMAEAMATASTAKEHVLLAVMAGRVSAPDAAAAAVGERIERRARARPTARCPVHAGRARGHAGRGASGLLRAGIRAGASRPDAPLPGPAAAPLDRGCRARPRRWMMAT